MIMILPKKSLLLINLCMFLGWIFGAGANELRILLNAFEDGSYGNVEGWRMSKMKVSPIESPDAKIGKKVFRFFGMADGGGGKADCTIYDGQIQPNAKVSLWVKVSPDSNVQKVGFQTTDNEGEGLFVLWNVDWIGWRRIETDFITNIEQAWEQKEKNKKTDFPIHGIRIVWFTKNQGSSFLDVDALELLTDARFSSSKVEKNFLFPNWREEDKGSLISIILNNGKGEKQKVELSVLIQEDHALYNKKSPDPILGSDHALGAQGWLIYDDQMIEDTSLTDGDDHTAAQTKWITDHFTEAYQIVDLGKELNVKCLKFRSGDANWIWLMDVLISNDGKNFIPVEKLQNINMHKRWGEFALGVKEPFRARYLKLHYKTEGNTKKPVIRMPCAMMVYDGIEDERIDFPRVGNRVFSWEKGIEIPAWDYLFEQIEIPPLPQGGYLIFVMIKSEGKVEIVNSNYFSFKPAERNLGEKSRFGINGADINAIPYLQQLGVGWIRFENMKWAFISPQKDKFAFDGSVAPWHVNQDELIKAYTNAGLSYLPYVFQTPKWATSAPEGHKNSFGFPPKDFHDYGTCIFQIVARYGSVKHPENVLLTNDKISGMGLLKVIELWNEPNLNAESWGPWVGSIESYFEIFRIGAEAAKRADPTIKVTSCGWAGIKTEMISRMQTYKYADGKTPLDFADILNVHFYSGKADPEIAYVDPNVERDKREPTPDDTNYETELRYLYEWWSSVKPGSPIWMTETGYDVGGPIGRDERYQAAKLPRCVMMALAAGIQKVFVYREIGSKPAQHAGSGLIREDRSYRPSFFTYATLIRELDGVKEGRVNRLIIKENPSIWLYCWEKENEKILTVWSLNDQSVLPLNLGNCQITDSFGRTFVKNVNSNLQLSIFPLYIKNIANFKEIEKLIQEAEIREKRYQDEKKAYIRKKKYLFDFGSKEFVGKLMTYGYLINYQPVLSSDIYDETKGWGFDKAAYGDSVAKWISSNIEKDSCKVKDNCFIVKTVPGRYNVEIHLVPIGKVSSLVVRSASGDRKIETNRNAPVVATKIQSDGKILFLFNEWGHLAWIRIIEEQ